MFGLGAVGLIIYVYTIFDVIQSKFHRNTDKMVWVLVVILLPLLGTVLWFVIGKGKFNL